MKKTEFSKYLEIAAGAAAVLMALGNFISAIVSPVQSLTSDYTETYSKVFRVIMGLERAVLFVPVIVLGVSLILRWVSQNKMKWVVLGSSAATALIFIAYQLTDVIEDFVYTRTNEYATFHPIRELIILLLCIIGAIIPVFLVYDAQSGVIKKNRKEVTIIAAGAAAGIFMFIDMVFGFKTGLSAFAIILLAAVLWRKELPVSLPVYFGMGGAAAAALLAFLNAFFEPLNLLLKNISFFSYLISYNCALIIIGIGLIPLMYLGREFIDKKSD